MLNTDLDETIDEPQSDEPEKKQYKTKFNWTDVILEVLKKKGEISIKKLRKKVCYCSSPWGILHASFVVC